METMHDWFTMVQVNAEVVICLLLCHILIYIRHLKVIVGADF